MTYKDDKNSTPRTSNATDTNTHSSKSGNGNTLKEKAAAEIENKVRAVSRRVHYFMKPF